MSAGRSGMVGGTGEHARGLMGLAQEGRAGMGPDDQAVGAGAGGGGQDASDPFDPVSGRPATGQFHELAGPASHGGQAYPGRTRTIEPRGVCDGCGQCGCGVPAARQGLPRRDETGRSAVAAQVASTADDASAGLVLGAFQADQGPSSETVPDEAAAAA